MSLRYKLLGMPVTLDEYVDKLKKKNVSEVGLNFSMDLEGPDMFLGDVGFTEYYQATFTSPKGTFKKEWVPCPFYSREGQQKEAVTKITDLIAMFKENGVEVSIDFNSIYSHLTKIPKEFILDSLAN